MVFLQDLVGLLQKKNDYVARSRKFMEVDKK